MFTQLFSDNVRKTCEICEYIRDGVNGKKICSRTREPVPEEVCRHYRYDPIKRIPKAPPKLPEFKAEDFDYR